MSGCAQLTLVFPISYSEMPADEMMTLQLFGALSTCDDNGKAMNLYL